ncbi:MAG TPA: P1 family peptidase [Anaerolineales bacterium]|nr:P1 family peptidase [Anaerolineales bacterium]
MDILSLTAISGISVGHAHDLEALTGCTVVLCPDGAVGGVDKRGGAQGTRQTDALSPLHLVDRAHGIVLSGGSAFGLDCASGAARYLEERGVGFDVRVARVPITPAAILFDLGIGRADVRPDAAMGYQACLNASRGPVAEGNVGAGAGATVGKILGMAQAMKAGLGAVCLAPGENLLVGALVAVNAFGDVVNPDNGRIIAGARRVGSGGPGAPDYFADTLEVMRQRLQPGAENPPSSFASPGEDTVIGVVITNARLTKVQATHVAQMAHDGLARTVRPAHTIGDGDTIFALATGETPADANLVGAYAAEAFAQAVLRAARLATSAGGLPGLASFL